MLIFKRKIMYIINVGFPTITINETRNKHFGPGGGTLHLHHFTTHGGEIGSTDVWLNN